MLKESINNKYILTRETEKLISEYKLKLVFLPVNIYNQLIEFLTNDYKQKFENHKVRQIQKLEKLFRQNITSISSTLHQVNNKSIKPTRELNTVMNLSN